MPLHHPDKTLALIYSAYPTEANRPEREAWERTLLYIRSLRQTEVPA